MDCSFQLAARVHLYAPSETGGQTPWPLSVMEGRKEIFYLTMNSTHFIYGYMASDIWLRTILIVRKKTRCRHIGYSFRLTARVLLYAPSHRQDNTYHGLCYTSCGALAGTRNRSMGWVYRKKNWKYGMTLNIENIYYFPKMTYLFSSGG